MASFPRLEAQELEAAIAAALSPPWLSVYASVSSGDYQEIWTKFEASAAAARENNQHLDAKVWQLLSHVCSMMLYPDSHNDPFKPIVYMPGGRSAIPQDFTAIELDFFKSIRQRTHNAWIDARLADLTWIVIRGRDRFTAGMEAIEAYRRIPLDRTQIVHALECWSRAAVLSLQLGKAGKQHHQGIASSLQAKLDDVKSDWTIRRMVGDILLKYELSTDRAVDNGLLLLNQGKQLVASGTYHEARLYFESAVQWFQSARDGQLEADAHYAMAMSFDEEASVRLASVSPSQIVATVFYDKCIQSLRRVSRGERNRLLIEQKIQEIQNKLSASSRASLEEMGTISTGAVDVSQPVEQARDSVRGKKISEAFVALASIFRCPARDKISSAALADLRRYKIHSLFGTTLVTTDGRVGAKRPIFDAQNLGSEDSQLVLQAEMVKRFCHYIHLGVVACIGPALSELKLEHRIRESDILELVAQSTVIPSGRVRLAAKAVFAGFEGDFATALHLLVPQVEHFVRCQLKLQGVCTSHLSESGIETEKGLSSIIDLPSVESILGENLKFEIKALFCDEFGPNLRNEVAHGLLDFEHCVSTASVYAWWFFFRLIVLNTISDATADGPAPPTP